MEQATACAAALPAGGGLALGGPRQGGCGRVSRWRAREKGLKLGSALRPGEGALGREADGSRRLDGEGSGYLSRAARCRGSGYLGSCKDGQDLWVLQKAILFCMSSGFWETGPLGTEARVANSHICVGRACEADRWAT